MSTSTLQKIRVTRFQFSQFLESAPTSIEISLRGRTFQNDEVVILAEWDIVRYTGRALHARVRSVLIAGKDATLYITLVNEKTDYGRTINHLLQCAGSFFREARERLTVDRRRR